MLNNSRYGGTLPDFSVHGKDFLQTVFYMFKNIDPEKICLFEGAKIAKATP